MYEVEEFPAPPWRRRLLIVLLALGTAATLILSMIYRPGGVERAPPPALPDAERCTDGRTTGCVGGRAEVILLAPMPTPVPVVAPGNPVTAPASRAAP